MPLRPLWKGFTYFEHQQEGINWMLDKEINGTIVANRDKTVNKIIRGGMQCDDMGLGKTIQIVATILNNKVKNTLIVSPLAMIDMWSDICQKVGFNVYEIDKDRSWKCMTEDTPFPTRFLKMRPSVYISNYEKIPHYPQLFKRSWDRVVLDEAHKIRNGDGEFAMYCRSLVATIRWAVTGTPLVNAKSDMVSLLAFIGVPYSPLWRYEPRYNTILPKVLIHRSLNSLRTVIKNAPPVPEIITQILPFATSEEDEFYNGIQGINEEMSKKYAKDIMSSAEKFKFLLRLRQLSVHPQVYINAMHRESRYYSHDDWTLPCTKAEAIKEIIGNEIDEVHKYIIFCQFNDEASLIRESLVDMVDDDNILFYNGSMTQKERGVVLQYSKESTETTVLIIQLQAGGVGLNLQEYDRIIFVSPWWTSALMDQAIARAVRMGQTKVVKVYHLILAAEQEKSVNIDKMMNLKAQEKRFMLEKIFEMCAENALEASQASQA